MFYCRAFQLPEQVVEVKESPVLLLREHFKWARLWYQCPVLCYRIEHSETYNGWFIVSVTVDSWTLSTHQVDILTDRQTVQSSIAGNILQVNGKFIVNTRVAVVNISSNDWHFFCCCCAAALWHVFRSPSPSLVCTSPRQRTHSLLLT